MNPAESRGLKSPHPVLWAFSWQPYDHQPVTEGAHTDLLNFFKQEVFLELEVAHIQYIAALAVGWMGGRWEGGQVGEEGEKGEEGRRKGKGKKRVRCSQEEMQVVLTYLLSNKKHPLSGLVAMSVILEATQ